VAIQSVLPSSKGIAALDCVAALAMTCLVQGTNENLLPSVA